MTYSSTFGPVIGREVVEQQVLALLQTPPAGSSYPLVVYYLAEYERRRGLQPQTLPIPPGTDSYRGGLDWDQFEEEWAPQITVLVQPTGSAERYNDESGEGIYGQWYEIQVGALVTEQDEDGARLLADRYAAALMLCLLQNGDLGTRVDYAGNTVPFATRTVLESAPRTDFLNDRLRRLVRSVVTIHSFVEQVVQETGPQTFGPNPYAPAPNWPTITSVDAQLQAENASGVFSPGSGVMVTDSTGHVIVSE